jgi:energy-converting hydrogenase Eha subunit A
MIFLHLHFLDKANSNSLSIFSTIVIFENKIHKIQQKKIIHQSWAATRTFPLPYFAAAKMTSPGFGP